MHLKIGCMVKRYVLLTLTLSSVFVSAQRSELQRRIDSIAQSKWNKTQLNLDSLANPVLETISLDPKDTIVVRDIVVVPQVPEEIPLTPFNLINNRQEKRWFFYAQNNLHFNQASFSNWNSGGNNNMGVLGKVSYNLSFKKDKHYLENILQLGYGFVASEGQATRKTEDFINLASNYGYELGRNYYLSTGYQFLSQFTPGYNYVETPDPEYTDRISKFMAPGYLNVGVGISYNPSEDFQVIFRPANGKFTFVLDPKLQTAGRYGLEQDGQSVRTELGANLNLLYRLKIYKDVHLVNQLNFFSNYVNHPERVDINYSGMLNMKFNRYISALIGVDVLYDHDQIRKTQMKQTLGIGFTYTMGAEGQARQANKKLVKPFVTK